MRPFLADAETPIIKSGADIDGEYRYRLWRYWRKGMPCLFIMLNPSTADTIRNDPTIRRCINFSKQWGFAGLEVCNIFALRSTDPDKLYSHADPVGYRNDEAIALACSLAGRIVLAWGNHGVYRGRGRSVLSSLRLQRYSCHAFRITSKGQPEHPLYQPNTVELLGI